MGCGCKDKKVSQKNGENEKVNNGFKEVISKMLLSVVLLIVLIITSPLLMLVIWYLAISSIYGKNSDILNLIFKAYNKKTKDKDDDLDEEYNPEDYELVGVDVIN
tara:strand:+ start:22162 stop:22476 length:315 start_codon:yes stop_codon:yes gene_type:complete